VNEQSVRDVLQSPAELKERLAAERSGEPILVYRDGDGRQRIVTLATMPKEVTIGRGPECDLELKWDRKVSRIHAELERKGGAWVLSDAGSRNGTFVNGELLVGRRRLEPMDQVDVGGTEIVFRAAAPLDVVSTAAADTLMKVAVSPAQRRVLVALCEPFVDASSTVSPPTNPQIAEQLNLSIPAVKNHLRALFQRFGIDDLPQNEKRARLARVALESGTVFPSDLRR
jgi:hypothetical protein